MSVHSVPQCRNPCFSVCLAVRFQPQGGLVTEADDEIRVTASFCLQGGAFQRQQLPCRFSFLQAIQRPLTARSMCCEHSKVFARDAQYRTTVQMSATKCMSDALAALPHYRYQKKLATCFILEPWTHRHARHKPWAGGCVDRVESLLPRPQPLTCNIIFLYIENFVQRHWSKSKPAAEDDLHLSCLAQVVHVRQGALCRCRYPFRIGGSDIAPRSHMHEARSQAPVPVL